MIVGLTGGIGAGKSTVARMLAARGAVVIDTDAVAREIAKPPSDVFTQLREEFGAGIVAPTGGLDRAALARIVFSDPGKRKRLNQITHPAILKKVLAAIAQYPPSSIVVIVAPLLFEAHFERNCDKVLAVVAPVDQRAKRIAERDGLRPEEIEQRLASQLPDVEYERRADIVIHNTGDTAALEQEVTDAWRVLARGD